MSLGGFTLADRLGAKSHPCKVTGCSRTWIELPGKTLGLASRSNDDAKTVGLTAGMCDPCRAKFTTLTDKERRCDTPGCQGRWTWPAAAQLQAFAAGKPAPRGICASCEEKLATLQDKEIACGVPGCARKAILSKRTQLLATLAPAPKPEAHGTDKAAADSSADGGAANAPSPDAAGAPAVGGSVEQAAGEHAAVEHAQGEHAAVEHAAVEHAAGEHASGQHAHGDHAHGDHAHGEQGRHAKAAHAKGPRPERAPRGKVTFEGPFCAPCTDVAKRIQDRPVSCGINGCKRKWFWRADEQIQAFAAGKPNEPPRRMCVECRASFGKLLDREVRCRTSGCKKTWTWSRFDQLDACVANKPAPKAPSHMCERCYGAFAAMKDIERPCRKSGCKRTWTDKRGGQLARLVRGKTGDPYPQYCSEHQKELGDLEEREVKCKTDGCTGTWTWTREQQLAAGVRPEPKPDPQEHGNEARAAGRRAPKAEGAQQARGRSVDEAAPQTHAAGAVEAAPQASGGMAIEATADAPKQSADVAGSSADGRQGTVAEDAEANAPDTVRAEGSEGAAGPAGTQGALNAGSGRTGRRRRDRHKKRRHVHVPERLCGACAEFLKDRKTLEIPCQQCATPIYWPPESQLQTHLGNWAAPAMCGACKRDATEKAREIAREALRHQGDEPSAPDGQPADAGAQPADAGAQPASTDHAAEASPVEAATAAVVSEHQA